MALRDDEERLLQEIVEALDEGNPELAGRLAASKRPKWTLAAVRSWPRRAREWLSKPADGQVGYGQWEPLPPEDPPEAGANGPDNPD